MKNLIIILALLGLTACGTDSETTDLNSIPNNCIESDIQADWNSIQGRQVRFDLRDSIFGVENTVTFEYNGTVCAADIFIDSNGNDCLGDITIKGITLEEGTAPGIDSCIDFPVDSAFSFTLLNDSETLRICHGDDCYNHARN